RSRTLRRAALILVAAVSAGIGIEATMSCGSTPQTNPPDGGAPIHIGVSIALQNDLGGTGTSLQNAVRVAEQQLNSYGGILGRRVVFDVKDDQSKSDTTLTEIINGFLNAKDPAILGPIGSTQVSVAQQLSYNAKTIQLSATATGIGLTDAQPSRDRYLFRTVPSDTYQAEALAQFAYAGVALFGGDAGTIPPVDAGPGDAGADAGGAGTPTPAGACRRMAIFYNNDDYGKPFEAALKPDFVKKGGQVILETAVDSSAKADYTAELTTLETQNPDCLALIVYDTTGDEIIHEIRLEQEEGKLSKNLLIIATDGSYTPKFIDQGKANGSDPNGTTSVQGVYGTNPDSNPSRLRQYGDFKNLYLSQYTLDPGQVDLPGQVTNFYDAAILTALAIQAAGTTDDQVKIRDSLFAVSRGTGPGATIVGPADVGLALDTLRNGGSVNYEGASGNCDFDDNGDVVGDYIIWQVTKAAADQPAVFTTVGKITASALAQ
ncbi:MAG: ABC transporter substrate-binding protein, partial [Polyangiaceae bacterium]